MLITDLNTFFIINTPCGISTTLSVYATPFKGWDLLEWVMMWKSVHSRADYLIGSKIVLNIAVGLLGPLEGYRKPVMEELMA